MKADIVYRTDTPSRNVIAMRGMSKHISKKMQNRPDECYLHIKDWQRYRGLTIAEASRRIGVTPLSYRNWCDNRHWPSSIHLPRMADAFDCSIEELFFPPPGMRQ